MWAQVNLSGEVVRVFPRPIELEVTMTLQRPGVNEKGDPITEDYSGRVKFPATIFSESEELKRLNIWPVRRVQVGAPQDTVGWVSDTTRTFRGDHVEQTETWRELPNADQLRAERDDRLAKRALQAKRAAFLDWMIDQGKFSEAQVTTQELQDFETEFAARGR